MTDPGRLRRNGFRIDFLIPLRIEHSIQRVQPEMVPFAAGQRPLEQNGEFDRAFLAGDPGAILLQLPPDIDAERFPDGEIVRHRFAQNGNHMIVIGQHLFLIEFRQVRPLL
ncbi:MAG: hypothetical protein V8T86_15275 [Victivallis sp.]